MPTSKSKKRGRMPRQPNKRQRLQAPAPYRRPKLRENGDSAKFVSAVCSQADPFCPHARAAKLYDRDSRRSVSFQLRETVNIGTDAAGQATLQIEPRLVSYRRYATAYAGATVTTWGAATDAPLYSTILSEYDKFRIVSFGVRCASIVAPLSAQGIVVGQVAPDDSWFPILTSDTATEVRRMPVYGCQMVYAGKRNPTSDTYEAINSGATHGPVLNLSVYGGPASTQVLAVEITLNVEAIAENTSFGDYIATPAWPHAVAVEAAAAQVAAENSSFGDSVAEFGARLRQAALRFAVRRLVDYSTTPAPFAPQANHFRSRAALTT